MSPRLRPSIETGGRRQKRPVAAAVIGSLFLSGCSTDLARDALSRLQKDAPELDTIKSWQNCQGPVRLQDLRGKVVLLDFATFSCVNCIHVLPFLKTIEDRYGGKVQVLTIHSGKYDNEKSDDYIKHSIAKYDLSHPVGNDADSSVWQSYGAKVWPTLVLIDPAGKIVGELGGDTKTPAVEKALTMLVNQWDSKGGLRETVAVKKICGQKSASVLAFPARVQVSGDRLFISDSGHNRIVIADRKGKVQAIIGTGCRGLVDGGFAQAKFDYPQGIAVKGDLIYVADMRNNAVRMVDLKKRAVSTLARGTKAGRLAVDDCDESFDCPIDVAESGGQLYAAMCGKHQIWRIDLGKKTAQVAAGGGEEGLSDGPAMKALLAQPAALAAAGDNLYFVDSESSAVRRLNLKDGVVSTIVGKSLFAFGDKDGDARSAMLQHPLGLTFANGTLYVADSFNHKVKTVDPETGRCATLVGSGKPGREDGEFATLSEPTGLSLSGNDMLYIADTNNNCVRVMRLQEGLMTTLVLRE